MTRLRFRSPMLATLSRLPLPSGQWILERKFDGERVLGIRDGADVELYSRSGRSLSSTYPELVKALARQPTERFVIDGEVVALDDRGVPSFERLQGRFGRTQPTAALLRSVPVIYYVFDLLELGDHDLTARPLRERKEALRGSLRWRAPLRRSDGLRGDAAALLPDVCAQRYEGLVAKRAESSYTIGRRSTDWLKLKCTNGQELVIGGWTEPRGSRVALGAILVGYYDGRDFVYAGKVGTGFDTATLRELERQLRAIERPTSPFARGAPPRAGVHWAEPRIVGEVEFSEWTRAGELRHARFKGLRDDKRARDVVREQPR
jgi:bifunctional non-homologous end joining protein LigD